MGTPEVQGFNLTKQNKRNRKDWIRGVAAKHHLSTEHRRACEGSPWCAVF